MNHTEKVDPLEALRSVGRRVADPAEALAQRVAERVTELLADALDVNALLDRVDINALLDRVEPDRLLDRVDADRLLDRVDVNRLLDRVDVDALAARLDVDQAAQRIDLEELLRRIDVAALAQRVDVNKLVEKIDMDALVQRTDLGAVIARSSGGVAGQALDVVRSQAVLMDEVTAGLVERLLRRRARPGPSAALGEAERAELDAVLGAGHAVPDEVPVALAESGPAGPDDEPASPPGP